MADRTFVKILRSVERAKVRTWIVVFANDESWDVSVERLHSYTKICILEVKGNEPVP